MNRRTHAVTLAARATEDEVAALALTDEQHLDAGLPLPQAGDALARAVKALPAAQAEDAACRITRRIDAVAVLAAERRKGVRTKLLLRTPLSWTDRKQFIASCDDEDLCRAACQGMSAAQAVAALRDQDLPEDRRTLITDEALRRLSRSSGHEALLAELQRRQPLTSLSDARLLRAALRADIAGLDTLRIGEPEPELVESRSMLHNSRALDQLARRPRLAAALIAQGLVESRAWVTGTLLERAGELAEHLDGPDVELMLEALTTSLQRQGTSHTRMAASTRRLLLGHSGLAGHHCISSLDELEVVLAHVNDPAATTSAFSLYLNLPYRYSDAERYQTDVIRADQLVARMGQLPKGWRFGDDWDTEQLLRRHHDLAELAAHDGSLPCGLIAELSPTPTEDLTAEQAQQHHEVLLGRIEEVDERLEDPMATLRDLVQTCELEAEQAWRLALRLLELGNTNAEAAVEVLAHWPHGRMERLEQAAAFAGQLLGHSGQLGTATLPVARLATVVGRMDVAQLGDDDHLDDAVLHLLRGRCAEVGCSSASALASLAALLDGGLEGSLGDAVECAVRLAA